MAAPEAHSTPREVTVVRAREARAALENGQTIPEIARGMGVVPERVRQWLKMPHVATSADAAPTSPAPEVPDVPAPRLSERTVTQRAVMAMRSDSRFRRLTDTQKLVWLEAVIAIRNIGDGVDLIFEGRFDDLTDFAWCCGGSDDDLSALFRRGLLGLLDGGVTMPTGLGLRAEENRGRGRRASPAASHPDPSNPSFLYGLEGGQAKERREDGNPAKTFGQTFGDNDQNILTPERSLSPNILETEQNISTPAGAASAAAYADSSNSSSNSMGGTSDGGQNPEPSFGQTFGGDHQNIIATSIDPSGTLAARLLAAARIERVPSPKELGLVRRWQALGIPEPLLLGVIAATLTRQTGVPPPTSLAYFAKGIDEARAEETRIGSPPAAPAAAPAAPLSPEDQAIQTRLKGMSAAWDANRGLPLPPTLDAFREMIAAGRGPSAFRWLDLCESRHLRGDRGRKPPDFSMLKLSLASFEADLIDCEDELTAPDSPG